MGLKDKLIERYDKKMYAHYEKQDRREEEKEKKPKKKSKTLQKGWMAQRYSDKGRKIIHEGFFGRR